MKILLSIFCLLAAGTSPLLAQKAGDVGAGVVVGDITGVTAKFWLTDNRAIDAGLGLGSDVPLYADYLWHSRNVLSQPSEGRMPVYLGVGAQLRTSSPSRFGVRAVAGIAYWLPHDPIELFLELVPVFHFSNGNDNQVNAGAGLRYYFSWN